MMKERKTKEDYRLETRFDPETGRETRVPVYEGKYYELPLNATERRWRASGFNALCALWWGGFLVYLFMGTPSTSYMLVLPVISLAVFPAFYWALGCAAFAKVPFVMTSTQRERSVLRIAHSVLGCAILSAMAIVGDLIMLLRGVSLTDELLGLAMLASLLGVACMAAKRALWLERETR